MISAKSPDKRLLDAFQSLVDRLNLETFSLQVLDNQFAQLDVVVYDEDAIL